MNCCKPSALIILLALAIMGSALVPITFNMSYRAQVIQNFMHIPVFLLLTVIVLMIVKNLGLFGWLWLACSVSVLMLIGVGQEIVQTIIPGRWPSYRDIHANMIGICLGISIYLLSERLKSGLIRRVVCK